MNYILALIIFLIYFAIWKFFLSDLGIKVIKGNKLLVIIKLFLVAFLIPWCLVIFLTLLIDGYNKFIVHPIFVFSLIFSSMAGFKGLFNK